jgi:hypothetical protein
VVLSSGRNVKLTIHLHLLSRLRMWSYTSSPSYIFMAYCLIKHKENFTFLPIHQFYTKPSNILSGMVFWVVMPYSSVTSRLFVGTICFHIQGRGANQARDTFRLPPVSAGFLLGLLFCPGNGDGMFLRNVELYPNYTASHPRRP